MAQNKIVKKDKENRMPSRFEARNGLATRNADERMNLSHTPRTQKGNALLQIIGRALLRKRSRHAQERISQPEQEETSLFTAHCSSFTSHQPLNQ